MDKGERNDDLAEILYKELMEACREAGSSVKQFPSAPHSPEMVRMRNILRLLRLAVTQFRTEYDLSDALEETQKKLGSIEFKLVPSNLQECQGALTHHERSFKALVRLEEQTKNYQEDAKSRADKEVIPEMSTSTRAQSPRWAFLSASTREPTGQPQEVF
jgi:hypothetical protein